MKIDRVSVLLGSALLAFVLCGLVMRMATHWSQSLLRDAICVYGTKAQMPTMRWASGWFVLWFVGAAMGLLVLLHDSPLNLAIWLGWFANLGLLGLIDARTGLLPNELTLAMMLSGLGFHAWLAQTWLPPAAYLWGMCLGWAVPYTLNAMHRRLRSTMAIGEGDAKLLAGIGAWLGAQALPLTWVLACLGVLVYTACVWVVGQRRPTYVVFGPFLAMGASATLFMSYV